MSTDLAQLNEWAGRSERRADRITTVPVMAMSATLDRDDPPPVDGDPLPPLWHWLYFLPMHRQSEIGPDGHAKRGGFLPPVSLPRRMWAGGRLEFRRALKIGAEVERISRIVRIDEKRGRSGTLVFVLVRHEIHDRDGVAITEEHDIVYRGNPAPGDPPPSPRAAPGGESFRRDIVPDDVLLFRYSALTFNGHRIHYDRRYVTEVEGYPGLIVHGPLIATLLIELARDRVPAADIAAFSFRAVSPLFDIAPFAVCGRVDEGARTVALWARNDAGNLAMEATATLR